jgi:phosphohistidine swiveling domain-containing protein
MSKNTSYTIEAQAPLAALIAHGGGKATNMARLTQAGVPVPPWFCVSSQALTDFVELNRLGEFLATLPAFEGKLADFATEVETRFLKGEFPENLAHQIEARLHSLNLDDRFVAVRSSGLDEDSAENSFAGQFSSYMFQKGMPAILDSLRRCWASGFSERALAYRRERGIQLGDIRVGVVVQQMVNADSAGVAFSRNPMHATDRETLVVSSVWGLGEGLVSGELDADHFEVNREKLEIKSTLVKKTHALRQAPQGGLVKTDVPVDQQEPSSLSDEQIREVSKLTLSLERTLGAPQDCEWAFEGDKLYFVQTRPITSLPLDAYFDPKVNGDFAMLWDNSNIIESYSGVTSPLTFSFASSAYRQVYVQFCEVVGVSREVILATEPVFRNMLGSARGRIYYNLLNWYKLVMLLPGASNNKEFMDTMMGVKQALKPSLKRIFDEVKAPPPAPLRKRLQILFMTLYRFVRINSIVKEFQRHFVGIYDHARKLDFKSMSLTDLATLYQRLDEQVLRRWHAPIINDYLCMITFGVLKKLTKNWVALDDGGAPSNGVDNGGASLQNDLLCGQGNLESTEPTKMLMRIASQVDNDMSSDGRATREWVLNTSASDTWAGLQAGKAPKLAAQVAEFLDRYGFRCINELKLEEPDLHDDPSFVLNAVSSYVRMKAYSIEAIEKRETEIREKAESAIRARLSGPKLWVYHWVVRQTRKAVANRENLRFARTKIFGVIRHLFRAVGERLVTLRVLNKSEDVFYLTVDEILAYIEGRAVTLNLAALVEIRRAEYDEFRKTPSPPERYLTEGAAGLAQRYPQVLADADLLRADMPVSTDPDVLLGTSCCPGVIEGVVRVVENMKDAEGINGDILVTSRTDPGWVPLYPSCSGLLIERGSLLSHSAVVARELGLPTIVGISGGLMTKLKTGDRVRIDAGRGEVRILR